MAKASVSDLRTRFARVRELIEREGEVIITDRGKAIMVLRPVASSGKRRCSAVDYFARLRRRQPKSIGHNSRQELDRKNRGGR